MRSLPLTALAMVGVLAVLGFLVLRPSGDEAGPLEVVGHDGGRLEPAPRPIDTPDEPTAWRGDAAEGPTAAARDGEGAADPPPVERTGLTVAGRVVMAEGGPLPADVEVALRRTEPWPSLRPALSGAEPRPTVEPEREPDDEPDDEAEDEDALARATRVAADGDGSFTLRDVPRGGAWVDVWSAELYLDEPVFARPGEDDLVLELARGGVLAVTVRDADGETPDEALVSLRGLIDPMMMFRRGARRLGETWRATEDGVALVRKVPAGMPLVLGVEAPGHAAHGENLAPLAPGETRELLVTLARGASVSGRVLDETGAPLGDVHLRLDPARVSMSEIQQAERRSREARSGPDGAFAFGGLAAGEYDLVAAAADRRPASTELVLERGEARDDVELRLERGLAVRGRVVDTGGEPLARARVMAYIPPRLLDVSSYFDMQNRVEVHADEDGVFEVFGFEPGDTVRVDVSAPGYVKARAQARPDGEAVVAVLERASTITGIVVSKVDGLPVEEYVLQLSPADGLFDVTDPMSYGEALTDLMQPRRIRDPEGRFSLEGVDPGEYELGVVADDHGRELLPDVVVEAGEDLHGLVVMLDRPAAVRGRVVARENGLPLHGAEVTTSGGGIMQTMTEAITGGVLSTTTDENGDFALEGLGEGRVRLSVRHDRYLTRSLPEAWVRPGEDLDLGLIEMGAGASVFGHVHDARGAPRSGVEVLVSDATGTTMKSSRTDDEGAYRVRGLAAGHYQVTVMDFEFSTSSDDFMSMFEDMIVEAVTLEADEQRELDLHAPGAGGATVHGTVRAAGGPEAGAVVSLVADGTQGGMPRFSTTDEAGRYELTGVRPGRHLMQVIPGSGEALSSGSPIVTPIFDVVEVVGEGRFRKDMFVPGGRLEGVALDAEGGLPVERVRVVLERTDEGRPDSRTLEIMGSRIAEAYTDEEGRFRFEHLPDGSYALVAGGANLLGLGNTDYAMTGVEGVDVREGRRAFTVRVEMDRGGRVEGTVTAPDREPVAQVAVWAKDADGRWARRLSETSTDANGVYGLPGLEEGRWTLAFRHPDHALTVVDGVRVRAGDATTRDVVLDEGPRVVVDLTGLDLSTIDPQAVDIRTVAPWGTVPLDLTALQDVLQVAAGSQPSGTTVDLGRLPPGGYDVSAWAEGALIGTTSVQIAPAPDPFIVSF